MRTGGWRKKELGIKDCVAACCAITVTQSLLCGGCCEYLEASSWVIGRRCGVVVGKGHVCGGRISCGIRAAALDVHGTLVFRCCGCCRRGGRAEDV